jgi:hypothetical protein
MAPRAVQARGDAVFVKIGSANPKGSCTQI